MTEDSPNAPFSRPRLEGLSTGELIKLAEGVGIDIPAGLERIFIIEELLESSNDEEREVKEEIQINPSYSESVALPKQYNISYVEVVIRDPLWAFVFWEIKGHDREAHENAADFNGYCLRVVPLGEGESIPKTTENSFTVTISPEDNARYIGFAEDSPATCSRYILKLSALRGDAELQLAASLPFNMPRLVWKENISEMEQNPLMRLSGAKDLLTIKNTDRQSRIKRL